MVAVALKGLLLRGFASNPLRLAVKFGGTEATGPSGPGPGNTFCPRLGEENIWLTKNADKTRTFFMFGLFPMLIVRDGAVKPLPVVSRR